jgi:hypothetical protein
MENLDILIGIIFVNLSTAIILWTIDYFVEHKEKFRFTLKKKKLLETFQWVIIPIHHLLLTKTITLLNIKHYHNF